MPSVPIDWVSVNWVYVVLLALFVFISTVLGNLLSFGERGIAAVLSALFFGVIFVFWSYFPHHVPLLPTRLEVAKPVVVAPPPAAPAAPVRPRNPVTTISPPPAPVPPPATPQ